MNYGISFEKSNLLLILIQQIMRKIGTILMILSNSFAFSQFNSPLEIVQIFRSIGYVNYLDGENTKNFLENRSGITLNIIRYEDNNLIFGAAYNCNSANLRKPFTIGFFTVPANTAFFINTFDIHFGYCFHLFKNITFEPYSGITETTIVFYDEEKDTSKEYFKSGIPIGFRMRWNVKLGKQSKYSLAFYINNSLNYNRLNKINGNLNSYCYLTEVGLGLIKEELTIKSRQSLKWKR